MYYTSARITHAYIYTSRMCIVYMLANLDNYYTHSLHAVRFAAPPIKPRQNALPVSPSILSILLLRFVFIDFCKLVFLSFFFVFLFSSSFFVWNFACNRHFFLSIHRTKFIEAMCISIRSNAPDQLLQRMFHLCFFVFVFFHIFFSRIKALCWTNVINCGNQYNRSIEYYKYRIIKSYKCIT